MTPETAHVRVSHVTKRFGGVTAVDDVSVEVPKGAFATLLGPSGCGPAATAGGGPCARQRAAGPALGRAALQSRREAPRAAAGRDAHPAAPPRHDLRVRDPRTGGGALALRLDSCHERRQGRAG